EDLGDTSGTWDADRLDQVLSNLIGNAVQHGAGNGVDVFVDGTDPEVVRVRVHNMGAIPGDLLPRLFEPLTGGAELRRDGPRGVGLGLFISKEIVAVHGGTLAVESSEAAGTTFTISLPRSGPAATTHRGPRPVAAAAIDGQLASGQLAVAPADPPPA